MFVVSLVALLWLFAHGLNGDAAENEHVFGEDHRGEEQVRTKRDSYDTISLFNRNI
jgi:hypothetical protein